MFQPKGEEKDMGNVEWTMITMPAQPELANIVYAKRDSYRVRADGQGIVYKAPELMSKDELDTYYKLTIVSRLIEKNRVLKDSIKVELYTDDSFDAVIFDNAWKVIHDYATTGGQNAVPGKSWSSPPSEAEPPS